MNIILGSLFIIFGLYLFSSYSIYIYNLFNHAEHLRHYFTPGKFLFLSFHAAGIYLPFFLVISGFFILRDKFSISNLIFFSSWMFPSFTLGVVFRLMFSRTYKYSQITNILVNYLSLEGTVILFTIISLILIIAIMQLPNFLVKYKRKEKDIEEAKENEISVQKEENSDSFTRIKTNNDSYINKFIDEKIKGDKKNSSNEFTVFFANSKSEFPKAENILKLKEKPLETFKIINIDKLKSKIYQKKYTTKLHSSNVKSDKYEEDKDVFVIEKKNILDNFEKTKPKNQDITSDVSITQKTRYTEKVEEDIFEHQKDNYIKNQPNSDSYESQTAVKTSPKPKKSVEDIYDYVFYNIFKKINPQKKYLGNKEKAVADSKKIVETLQGFSINTKIDSYFVGPIVTVFELIPLSVVKITKILGLTDNIALALKTSNIRMFSPIPGKDVVGIEVPNEQRDIIRLSTIIKRNFNIKYELPFILGINIMGEDYILDIAKSPHILIAGATGSGKSVCLNSLISSLIFYKSPQEVKLVLIDPKIVEFNIYNDLPHLLMPPITEKSDVLSTLILLLEEMQRRYSILKEKRSKNIQAYNNLKDVKKLSYIVIIIDEYADLTLGKDKREIEDKIVRLANMSRAVGIHLVIATQRPSANVITGNIKANIPTKIAFSVSSNIDSRVILNCSGAEKLLGNGDMLISSYDSGGLLVRSQGAYIDEEEIENLVEYSKIYQESKKEDEDIKSNKDNQKSIQGIKKEELYGLSPTDICKKFSLTYENALKVYNYLEENK